MGLPQSAYSPIPELVEDEPGAGPYEIRDSCLCGQCAGGAKVSLIDRVISVPRAPGGEGTRRHELGHVRWSPADAGQMGDVILRACEDARINLGLERVGAPHRVQDGAREVILGLFKQDALAGAAASVALRAVTVLGTDVSAAEVLHAVGQKHAGLVARVTALARERLDESTAPGFPVPPFAATLALAAELRALFAGLGVAIPAVATTIALVQRSNRDVHPGRMTIVRPPLTERVAPGRGALVRAWASEEGSVPRLVHRWWSDRRVFRGTRRVRGGSVLVDQSGSMSLAVANLDAALAAAPALLVAAYSGQDDAGELRIIAAGGLRAATALLATDKRGNIIDLPALLWLARQPRPRVWVSDGGVTGVGDQANPAINLECAEVVRRAGIVQVKTLGDFAAALGKAARR